MDNKNGFTLIELVIVVVILAILAAVSAPRFINLSSDANVSALESMEGALASAGDLIYSKAVIQGVHLLPSSSVDLDNDGIADVDTEFGYPSDSRSTGITQAMSGDFVENWAWSTRLSPQRVVLTTANVSSSGAGQKVNNVPITTQNCYITYIAPNAVGDKPDITKTVTGC